MPTYECHCAPGTLTADRRGALARRITDVHHRITQAPASFVQVLFSRVDPGAHFVGGVPADPGSVFVSGTIRAGRTDAVVNALGIGIRDAVTEVAGVPPDRVWVYLTELPETRMIEFGRVLPPAGAEATWLAALPPALRDRLRELDGT